MRSRNLINVIFIYTHCRQTNATGYEYVYVLYIWGNSITTECSHKIFHNLIF